MRLSIDELRQKGTKSICSKSEDILEFIDDTESIEIRGGDKEYNPPIYEQKYKSIWQKANILLDNLK